MAFYRRIMVYPVFRIHSLNMAKLKHSKQRKAVINACLAMNRLGINQGTAGNISIRVRDGFLITPSGIAYEQMTPEQIVFMRLDGSYVGDWLPSSEWRMHLDILTNFPQAGAVVHTHSIYATAVSTLRKDVPAFHYMIACAGGTNLRCARYATFGTAALSTNMLRALRDRRACLLANHGAICWGEDLNKALWLAGEVETLCHQYVAAQQMGEPVVLAPTEMKRVLNRFSSYGKQRDELSADETASVQAPVRRDN